MGIRDILFGGRKQRGSGDGKAEPKTVQKPDFEPAPAEAASFYAWKTPGNASPADRAKIFYCAHPDDFSRYLEILCEDIFAHERNHAAVFYLTDLFGPRSAAEQEQAEELLSDMKLVLFPVTSNFLYLPNPAREWILPKAQALHIPVLPVVMEKDLEQDFSRICGTLHCFNRVVVDETQIPYSEKLKKFLSDIVEDDTLSEKIRSAFDAYIFLSYRKKDRKYAKEIMRLIHKNDFARDIAIWYDEYLLPGEDFNDSIEKALNKSSLFALAITPSLLELPNYVWEEEYRRAKSSGKTILGIQAKQTNADKLKKYYEGLEDYAVTSDEEDLRLRLEKALKEINFSRKDSSAEHLFFVGLAYLGGIDMEKNTARALSLITEAADQELPEAMKKLVFMYRYGEGTQRDPAQSRLWQEDLFRVTWDLYCDREYAFPDVFDIAMDLIDFYFEDYDYDDAADIWSTIISSTHEYGDIRLMMRAYDKGGDILTAREEFEKAARLYVTALGELKEQPKSSEKAAAMALFYKKIANFFMVSRAFEDAVEYYQKGLDAISDNAPESMDYAVRQAKADLLLYKSMAIERAFGDYTEAVKCAEEGIAAMEKIAAETGYCQDRRYAAESHQVAENLYRKDLNLQKARSFGERACEEYRKIAEETGTPDSLDDLALSLNRLSWYEDDERLRFEANKIWTDLAERYPGVPRFQNMADSKKGWDEAQRNLKNLRANRPF